MKSKMRITKILALGMVLTTVFALGMKNAEAVWNVSETDYSIEYSGKGEAYTPNRYKEDHSPAFIRNTDSECGVKVNIWATDEDGTLLKNCSLEPYKQVNVGQSAYFKNTVKDDGYDYCRLSLLPELHSQCHLGGKWTPDTMHYVQFNEK